MGFPLTGVIDSFDRVDAASLGGNWTDDIVGGSMAISGNAAVGETAGDNTASYTAQSFGPNCEAWFTFDNTPPFYTGVWLRQGPGAGGNGYRVTYDPGSSGRVGFSKYTSAVRTALGADITGVGTVAAGDRFGAYMIGDTITAWIIQSGVETVVGSRTDTTYTGANNLGLLLEGTTAKAREFGGGNLGITASGLVPAQRRFQHLLIR